MPDIEDVDGRWNARQSVERLDSHLDIPLRKRADSISVITVDTADLDCQFTRPDQEGDKMIEEEKSKTGKVQCNTALQPLYSSEALEPSLAHSYRSLSRFL